MRHGLQSSFHRSWCGSDSDRSGREACCTVLTVSLADLQATSTATRNAPPRSVERDSNKCRMRGTCSPCIRPMAEQMFTDHTEGAVTERPLRLLIADDGQRTRATRLAVGELRSR